MGKGHGAVAVLLVLVLGSCGGNFSAPRNLDNACALAAERPKYFRAMKATEREWGVPVPVQMAVIHQESKFIGNARTPFRYALGVIPMGRQSSAYGYSQALDDTWREYQQEQGRGGARRDRIQEQPVSGLSRRPHRVCPRQLQRQALAGGHCRAGGRPRGNLSRAAGGLPQAVISDRRAARRGPAPRRRCRTGGPPGARPCASRPGPWWSGCRRHR